MDKREDQIYREAAALWRAVFDEPPPAADGSTILDILTRRLPMAEYQRLRSLHLRPATITGPGQARRRGELG